MNMFVRRILVTVLGVVLVAPAAFADPAGRPQHRPVGINKREHRQTERIKHGVKHDEITKGEANRLKADEAAIRAEEKVYRRSGDGLTKREVKDLENDLNKTSRKIKRATHNDKAPASR
jgi:hypothetical protein